MYKQLAKLLGSPSVIAMTAAVLRTAMLILRRRGLAFIAAAVTVLACIAAAPTTAQAAVPTTARAAARTMARVAVPTTAQLGTATQTGTTTIQIRKRALYPVLCLRNSDTHCAAFDPIAVYSVVLSTINTAILVWKTINKKSGDGGTEEGAEGEGTASGGSTDQGLCLADTGGNAYMTGCSDNGTVWIQYSCGNGICLKSRYYYNKGENRILTTSGTATGDHLYVAAPGTSGTWQKWVWL